MAAIKINENYAAERNVEWMLTSWWEKDLDADMHKKAEWDKFFLQEERWKEPVSHKTDHCTFPPELTCPRSPLARHQQTLEIRLIEFGLERLAHMPRTNYTHIKNVCTSQNSKSCHKVLSWFFCIWTLLQTLLCCHSSDNRSPFLYNPQFCCHGCRKRLSNRGGC